MKSYLVSYKFAKKNNIGIVQEGLLGFDGSLKFGTHPSQAEVLGLIYNPAKFNPKDYQLVSLAITTLPDNWLTKKEVEA